MHSVSGNYLIAIAWNVFPVEINNSKNRQNDWSPLEEELPLTQLVFLALGIAPSPNRLNPPKFILVSTE